MYSLLLLFNSIIHKEGPSSRETGEKRKGGDGGKVDRLHKHRFISTCCFTSV